MDQQVEQTERHLWCGYLLIVFFLLEAAMKASRERRHTGYAMREGVFHMCIIAITLAIYTWGKDVATWLVANGYYEDLDKYPTSMDPTRIASTIFSVANLLLLSHYILERNLA